MAQIDDYFERDSDEWEQVQVLARRPFQSPEVNEMQTIARNRHKRLGDALFSDGDVIAGCDVLIDASTGATTVTGGRIYVRGDVREVAGGALTIPVVGKVEIGLLLTETSVTELEDPGLRNPVPGAESYNAPGAARLVVRKAWGWRSGGLSDGAPGDFYPVFDITNGVLDNKAPPPQLDGVSQALARYDRAQTGGSYVVAGMGVVGLEIRDGHQVFSLQEGRCHVDGFEVEKPTATRLAFPVDPDLTLIEEEPHTFTPVAGSMRLNVIYGPIAEIVEVKVLAERVDVSIVHGSYSGAVDNLPNLSILQIVSVKQGATTYVQGTDYKRTGNAVDWSLSGAEPAPGSTYTVTYRYQTAGMISAADDRGFTLQTVMASDTSIVSGSVVNVDYMAMLPRRDRVIIARDGQVSRVRGVSDLTAPSVPDVPGGFLLLATLVQRWFALPDVVVDAAKIMPVSDILRLNDRVDKILDLVAIERLKTDATAREPTGQRGWFVDPFFDNDMRDEGVSQNAAVVNGELILPIRPFFPDPLMAAASSMLSYTLEPAVEQLRATGSIRVNPYNSFTPLPPKVTVITPVDRWTQDTVAWDTESIRFTQSGHFVPGVSVVMGTTTVAESIETLRTETRAAQFLRQIPLIVRIEGLGNGEIVPEIRFDGVVVGGPLVAGPSGVIEHQFNIPPGIPAGSKRVEVTPAASGTAVATFVGEGIVQTAVRRRVATVDEFHVDPVAQSITLRQGRHVGGVDLRFTARGATPVVVQMRNMTNGFPGRDILAEARRQPADLRIDGQPTRFEWAPVWMPADEEFAIVVLCDDADAEVAIATVGDFDAARQNYVTAQPYQIGVMFSSSNGTSWTPHQASDLWFRLLGCRFTATSRTVPLGELAASQVSDLIGLFSAERPDSGTRVVLQLVAADGRVFSLSDGQPINLTDRLTGNVSVRLVLEGTDIRSPVVFAGVQAIFGVQSDTATYVGRQFATPSASKIRVVLDAITPGTSTVGVEVQAANGSWLVVPLSSGSPIGDGWEERVFVLSTFSAATTRVRLTLNGSALNRPRVRKLRVIAA